ncbi:MAG: metallophosphoesterase, partial [Elusimicrobiota bacterium]|jgi:2',3'-cyclic-nucleotide 2'-phosphodiesterase (5'-nucleotidase family)
MKLSVLLALLLSMGPVRAEGTGRFPPCDPKAERQRLVFVHVSDIHANYSPGPDGASPMARLRGYFELVRSTEPYALFTDGGDSHDKGSVLEQISKGWSTDRIVRSMRYDVRTMGNHDFAWGGDEAFAFSRDTATLVLASNLSYTGKDPSLWGAKDYGELQVGCVRVGFFGMVSRSWSDQDEPSEAPHHPDVASRLDYAAVARDIVSRRRKDVGLLVMVSHLGLEADEKLAAEVPGIDLVLGAHTHDITWKGRRVGDTFIIQAGNWAKLAGRVEVDYDLRAGTAAAVTGGLWRNDRGKVKADPAVQRAVEAEAALYAPDLGKELAFVKQARDKRQIAAVAAAAARGAIKADAALVDAKTAWAVWTPGAVDLQGVYDTFKVERQPPGGPGFSSFMTAEVSGKDLALIRDKADAGRFAFSGPEAIAPGRTYTLALQKRTASAPGRWLPTGVSLKKVQQAGEVWEVLKAYAASRTAACLHLDTDDRLPDCVPK